MTVEAVLGFRETDSHVQPRKRFFPSKIPILHYQLRHLITSPSESLVYFVNFRDVYCIDTATSRRSHVAELPFEAFCTATGFGWYCAGGRENGYFAAFRLPEINRGHRPSDPSVPDGPVSDLPNSTRDAFDRTGWAMTRSIPPRIRIEKLGEEILNSISIHKIRGPNTDEDDIVAILTNNDRTVRMYSLTNDVELRVEHFDFAMNHATISPDGRILMIVGDREWAYFYDCRDTIAQAKNKSNTSNTRYEHLQHPSSRWALIQKLKLYKPPRAEATGYFTTAWSQSGKLCATASDDGFITVFNTEVLWNPEEDPVAAIVPSSRPNTDEGAVRAMAFAPEPWDLLIWTEHCARVAIGDLRNGLASRQVIDLDPKSEDVTRIDLTDASHLLHSNDMDFSYESLLHRNLSESSHGADENSSLFLHQDYLSTPRERRRLQRQTGLPELGNELQSLTEAERQVIDGLRTTSQRQNALADLNVIQAISRRTEANLRDGQSIPAPRSPYTPQSPQTPLTNGSSPISTDNQLTADRIWTDIRLGPRGNSIFREAAVLGTIRDYIRDQGRDYTTNGSRRGSNAGASPSTQPQQQGNRRSFVLHSPPTLPQQQVEAGISNSAENNTGTVNAATMDNSDNDDDDVPALLPGGPTTVRENAGSSAAGTSGVRAPLLSNELRGAHRNSRARPFLRNNRNHESMRAPVDGNGPHRPFFGSLDLRDRESEMALNDFLSGRAGVGSITSTGPRFQYGEGAEDYLNDSRNNIGSTGIAFSDEGRTLFVGTHEGVFEMKMNFQERKFWPAITPR